MLRYNLLGALDLYRVNAVEVVQRPRPQALAAAFGASGESDGDLGATPPLGNHRLPHDQVVVVLLVAAADDVQPVIQEQPASRCSARTLRLPHREPETLP